MVNKFRLIAREVIMGKLFGMFVALAFGAQKEYINVCYLTSWSFYRAPWALFTRFMPEYIDPHLCTHIIYAYTTVNAATDNIELGQVPLLTNC